MPDINPTAPEISIEDDIAATFDSIMAGNSDVEAGRPTEGEKPASTTGSEEEFSSNPASASTSDPSPAEQPQDPKPGEDGEVGNPSTIPTELEEVPKSWGKDAADIWSKLPAEARSIVLKRENDFHRGLEQYKNDAQIGRTLSSALNPYMATINSLQTTPEVAIKALFNADHKLRYGNEEQKLQYLAVIANDYGIDITKLKPLSDLPAPDPQINLLNQRVEQLSSTIEEQRTTVLNNEITRFASDSANPHFQDVRGIMADLLEIGRAKDLKDAYEQAIWLHPEVRAKVIADQHRKEQQRLQDERKKQDQIARKAQGKTLPSSTSRPLNAQPTPAASLDESIGAALDDILLRQG